MIADYTRDLKVDGKSMKYIIFSLNEQINFLHSQIHDLQSQVFEYEAMFKGKRMEKGRDEDNVQEPKEERLARIRIRNNEDFERFGRFTFANINEEIGGLASQRKTKKKKSTAEKPIVEVTRVLRSQLTRDVEEMPCDNIQEHEGG
ncbi:40S ribosomal protein S5-1 [Hordeum vulgare]|nr:40S ribosomal protein S5-1 [Hordeum vulgare]